MANIGSIVTNHVPDRIVSKTNVFTQSECSDLIIKAEARGFKPSAPSGGGHGQHPNTGARTSQFLVTEDDMLAKKLWTLMNDIVPKDLHSIKPVPYMNSFTKGDEWTPIGVNPHIRYYKYDKGQYVLKHDDYRMSRYRYSEGENKWYQQMSFLTILVYLNEEFSGGNTAFWTKYATPDAPSSHCRYLREVEFESADLIIPPQTGKVLLQDHVVQHEGEEVTKGTKYIIRTDVLHEKEVSPERIQEKFKKGQVFGEWSKHYEPSCLNYTE